MQRFKSAIDFAKAFWAEWSDDNIEQLASSLAYYAIFSLSPLVVIAMAIISFFFEREAAKGEILAQVSAMFGQNVTELIASVLNNASTGSGGVIAGIISFATLLWGAASVFGHLQNALNTIWDVDPDAKSTFGEMIRRRALSFGLVIFAGLMGLLSLLLTNIFSSLSAFVDLVGINVALWDAITNWGISFVVIAVVFALIYKVLPDVSVPWRDAWLGAGVASLMFVVGKSLLGWYFANNSTISVYGAAGSLVALLLWIYYSSQIFFFGAEFSQVVSSRRQGHLAQSPSTAANSVEQETFDPQITTAPMVAAPGDRSNSNGGSSLVGAAVLAAWMVLGIVLGNRNEINRRSKSE